MKDIVIDPAKLLGFRLAVVQAAADGNAIRDGAALSAKIGVKVGTKPPLTSKA
ncbi:MAG: hypothetical protein U1D35_03870 [Paracoccaceae bacterium]|nr:hypothetical protein [Paracoccaceae bacterium]